MGKADLQTELLHQIAVSLNELVTWTRVTSYPAVKHALETTLDTEQKRAVYQLLDGTRTVSAIQKLSGVNARFISEWGREWERIGIVKDSDVSGRKGRRERAFDISMFGMAVPENLIDNTNDAE